jgi:predicted component of type VI protein secretion system
MLPLVITIKQVDGGTRRYAFAESPVSIGRSPFAELQLLEPFISRWEGTLRFDEDEITYFRLGSTNATYVNGERLERCEDDVPLRVDSVLTVGDLELRFSREPVPEPDLRRKGKRRPTREDTATGLKTQYLEAGSWAKARPAASAPGAASPSAALAREARAPVAPAGSGSVASAIAPLSCIVLGSAPLAQPRTCGPTLLEVPAGSEGAAAERVAATGAPAAGAAAAVAASVVPLHPRPRAQPGEIPELRAWLQAINPDVFSDKQPLDDQLALARVLGLLEVLVQSLAEIHDAQESVRRRWLGRSARRSILQSDDGNMVLAYLLNPQADWNARLRELEELVRDVVTHELALFRATLEGARTLVNALSPEVVASNAGADTSAGPAPGFWTKLLCKDAGDIGLWRRFRATYAELTDGARYERVFLGRVFSRSYLAAMGRPDPARG